MPVWLWTSWAKSAIVYRFCFELAAVDPAGEGDRLEADRADDVDVLEGELHNVADLVIVEVP